MSKINQESKYRTVLDSENVSGILLYLRDHKEAVATELRDNVVPTYNRLKDTMKELNEAGLVTIEYTETPRITYTYRLTEKGKKIAEMLAEIDKLIRA